MTPPCCEYHNRNCEPPSELCCGECTEVHHGLHGCPGATNPDVLVTMLSHHDGSVCIAPDLSGFGA